MRFACELVGGLVDEIRQSHAACLDCERLSLSKSDDVQDEPLG